MSFEYYYWNIFFFHVLYHFKTSVIISLNNFLPFVALSNICLFVFISQSIIFASINTINLGRLLATFPSLTCFQYVVIVKYYAAKKFQSFLSNSQYKYYFVLFLKLHSYTRSVRGILSIVL